MGCDVVKCALVSMDQRWRDKAANRTLCEGFADRAQTAGCDLLIFPEMTLTGYALDTADIVEQERGAESLAWFGDLAQQHNLTVIFGTCLQRPGRDRPRNVLGLARPDGGVEALYEKIHPFSLAGEDAVFGAGDTLGFAEVRGMRLGMAICYDLRFPELYAAMSDRCDALVTIANWPARRVGHWRILLQARAIENQCYALGVNRIGEDGNGLRYEKSSMVVAPDGEVIAPMEKGDELEIYTLDLKRATDYRRVFPTVRDKRRTLYPKLLEDQSC